MNESSGMDLLNKTFQSMNNAFAADEAEKSNSLREEALILFHKLFNQDEDPEKIKAAHIKLIKKFNEFEENILNFPILNFLYAIIARLYLNIRQYDLAVLYAQAGIESNKNKNDQEGVNVNLQVLLDTACFMGAFNEAIKLFDNHPGVFEPHIKRMLSNKLSRNDELFKKLIESKKRPKSLAYCLDEKRGLEEKAIRTIMCQMKVSRSTALKYTKEVRNFPE